MRDIVRTKAAEDFYRVLKHGMNAIDEHCYEKHLHHYVSEQNYRSNKRVRLDLGDAQRTENALCGILGKRVAYETPDFA